MSWLVPVDRVGGLEAEFPECRASYEGREAPPVLNMLAFWSMYFCVVCCI